MGASVAFNADSFRQSVMKDVSDAKTGFLDEAVAYMEADLKSAIDNRGLRDGVTKRWVPNAMFTLLNRKTYPKDGTRQQQDKYLDTAVPLKDTGALQRSIAELASTKEGGVETRFVGAGVDYIGDHEEGKGNSPERKNQYFSVVNMVRLTEIFRRWFGG
jgi:hypothetical protein